MNYEFCGIKHPKESDLSDFEKKWDVKSSPFENALNLYSSKNKELDIMYEFCAENFFNKNLNLKAGINNDLMRGFKEYSIGFNGQNGKVRMNYFGWIIGELINEKYSSLDYLRNTDFIAGKLFLKKSGKNQSLNIEMAIIPSPRKELWGVQTYPSSSRVMEVYYFSKNQDNQIIGKYVEKKEIKGIKTKKFNQMSLEQESTQIKNSTLFIEDLLE